MGLQGSISDPLVLNPLTPMAYLSPDLAYEVTVMTYVFVASLGVSRLFSLILLPGF